MSVDIKHEWQLVVPKGHGIFKDVTVIHTFKGREEALAFLADFVAGPAIKAGNMPPEADLRCIIRHDHQEPTHERVAMLSAVLRDIIRACDKEDQDEVLAACEDARSLLGDPRPSDTSGTESKP